MDNGDATWGANLNPDWVMGALEQALSSTPFPPMPRIDSVFSIAPAVRTRSTARKEVEVSDPIRCRSYVNLTGLLIFVVLHFR